MPLSISYTIYATPWLHIGKAAWHFISLPQNISTEIRQLFQHEEEGWGRLKVTACIGIHEWKTAIWYDSKHRTFLLPIKAEIRKKCAIQENREIEILIRI